MTKLSPTMKVSSRSRLLLPLVYAKTKDQVDKLQARITKIKRTPRLYKSLFLSCRDETARLSVLCTLLVTEENKGIRKRTAHFLTQLLIHPCNNDPRGIPGSGKSRLNYGGLDRLDIPRTE